MSQKNNIQHEVSMKSVSGINKVAIKNAKDEAKKMHKTGETLASFGFGKSNKKSVLWISSDKNNIMTMFSVTVEGSKYYVGLKKS